MSSGQSAPTTARRRLRLVVLCPHFAPDTAPTGDVMTRIVHELAARGHELHVVTSLPWYRTHAIEPGWGGRRRRVETTAWGSITRVDPFPGYPANALGNGPQCHERHFARGSGRNSDVVEIGKPIGRGRIGRGTAHREEHTSEALAKHA